MENNSALITLGEVFDKVDKLSKHCRDELIEVSDISFDDFNSIRIGNKSYKMKTMAKRSIGYRLGIPFNYLNKCPSDMQNDQLNHWIKKEKNDQLFFRFNDNSVRAIFTPRYKPIDNFEILERLDSFGYSSETKVQARLDEEFMFLNIPNDDQTFSIKGDSMKPGISISNSEIGLASLSISAFILRLVCTNGLVVRESERVSSFRHISNKNLDKIPEVLNHINTNFDLQKDKFELSLKSKVDDPFESIKSFNSQFQLKEIEREAVFWGAEQEQEIKEPHTMFHIINAYTKAAQYQGLSSESSFKLQKTGGDILSLLN